MRKIIYILSFTIIILACNASDNNAADFDIGQDPVVGNTNSEFNLLFIGNSLTSSNNLPELVKEYAKTQGKDLFVASIVKSNYALIDHWKEGAIQASIESKSFDFVMVQQGPSSQPDGRALLIEYGGLISELCNSNDAKLAYYMVWPSLANYDTFDGVINSYRIAANRTNDILCPVGEVWKSYFDETGDFSYYGSDGFHPSLAGSTVAAQVIYESLFVN